jgi:DNA-binding MarR family transcriptional regulator
MDYHELALDFMEKMYLLRQTKPHKQLDKSMQGECFVMQYIAHQKGSVVPSEISNIMDISSARVAAALNSLERKGMITRDIDPGDRRRILVNLTPKGEEMAKEHNRKLHERTVKLLSLLGEDDAKEYVRLTGKLASRMSRMKEDAKQENE